jgi:hypothetical protein
MDRKLEVNRRINNNGGSIQNGDMVQNDGS